MTVCLMLALGISLAQGWDRPAIQEAELAAPEGMDTSSGPSGPRRVTPTSESWDADSWNETGSDNPLLTPMNTNAPAETRETPTQEKESSPPAPSQETVQAPDTQTDEQPRRIVTFWFILPRR